eukprot:COSAG06_NODE_2774_length_6303_cov_15.722115_8_plen_67_part_00
MFIALCFRSGGGVARAREGGGGGGSGGRRCGARGGGDAARTGRCVLHPRRVAVIIVILDVIIFACF